MLKNFTHRQRVHTFDDSIDFDIDESGGFSFPCDEHGRIGELPPEAKANYEYCMSHPEKFIEWNVHRRSYREWTEPASGDCVCGNRVELWDQYQGACECANCGRWYNLFGQELLPPEQWEREYDEY